LRFDCETSQGWELSVSARRQVVREANVRFGVGEEPGRSGAVTRQLIYTMIVSALIVGEWAAFGQAPEDVSKTAGAREIKVPAFIFPAAPPADLLLPQKPASTDTKPKSARAFA
jgi:hypothetical protein